MGRKRKPSQTEARREKSPKLSRDELEMGPTVRALVPQGKGQADLALLYILGALDWLVLNMTQKMN